MGSRKLKLKELKVMSFVTSFGKETNHTIKGGGAGRSFLHCDVDRTKDSTTSEPPTTDTVGVPCSVQTDHQDCLQSNGGLDCVSD